jgi:C4-dicarboxylate-specific signal transduction histidine kinase
VSEARRSAERIIRDGSHASDVIARIRGMLNSGAAVRSPVAINTAIEDVLGLLQNELHKHRIDIVKNLDLLRPTVIGDRVHLQQLFMNLFMNGIEAVCATQNQPRVIAVRSRFKEGQAHITVQDSGNGIAPHIIDHVFDAFVTTKPSGMGLGLAICRSIAESHGGTLVARQGQTGGALFEVILPENGAEL